MDEQEIRRLPAAIAQLIEECNTAQHYYKDYANKIWREQGTVPLSRLIPKNHDIIYTDGEVEIRVGLTVVTLISTDRDGDQESSVVPMGVLTGEMSVEDWCKSLTDEVTEQYREQERQFTLSKMRNLVTDLKKMNIEVPELDEQIRKLQG